jgi:hypothetical protein
MDHDSPTILVLVTLQSCLRLARFNPILHHWDKLLAYDISFTQRGITWQSCFLSATYLLTSSHGLK